MNIESNMRLIIIEDELHNSRMLSDMVKLLRPDWNIEAVLESIEESVEWLANNRAPQLILMDIQLSDGISFSIFDQVELNAKTHVIFTTAYDKYAIRAFKVNSLDYLLKPIKEAELEFAFQKLELHVAKDESFLPLLSQEKEVYKSLVASILRGEKEYRTRFLISGIKDYIMLETLDIAYFYSSNKATFAYTKDKKLHLLAYTLEQIEDELDPKQFFRANRQVILNIESITKISNDVGNKLKVKVSPEADFEINVSRLKAAEFKMWLGK